ncbi:MAG: glycosyl hydrolase family 79 C-terminal domain-containing protein [Solirubrobacteraceae bacterium]
MRISLVDRGAGRAIPRGFLGLSFEFPAVKTYTGTDPAHINPVLVALIRNLTPGQAPVLRIGGDSTDVSYVPTSGVKPPPYVGYALTPAWLATTGALARTLGARMIIGLNLAANSPPLAAAESRAYTATFGRAAIDALEIGNEPNIYGKLTVYHTVLGIPVPARPPGFDYADFHRQFEAVAAATPLELAGPALAIGPTPTRGSWSASMPGFLKTGRRLAVLTVHRYPLRNCYVPPSSRQYPTIPHLLSSYATAGLAHSLEPWIAIAHRAHRQLRVDELNSVACRGKAGVSDTFASALWVTDALFALARAGVDGVNVHTLPNAAYELFQFSDDAGRWSAQVRPVYYGLQLFAQAAPAGSQLLKLPRHSPGSGLSTWATRAPDHTVRVVVINKDPTRDRTVTIRPPDAGHGDDAASVERMLAPAVTSPAGVTLGDRSYGTSTSTGVLPAPRVSRVRSAGGGFNVVVPHGSAALVTIPAASTQ